MRRYTYFSAFLTGHLGQFDARHFPSYSQFRDNLGLRRPWPWNLLRRYALTPPPALRWP